MDITLDILPDPRYDPLCPSISSLIEYAEELEAEGHCITIEWATNEIKNHLFSYVRVGLVADAVRRYRKYEDTSDFKIKCRDFNEYCRKVLGKSQWYINKIIDAAKVCIKLLALGFESDRLPDCEFQARPLVKVYQKAAAIYENFWRKHPHNCHLPEGVESPPIPEEVLQDKWQQVLDEVPNHQITGNKIAEIVEENPQPPVKEKVYVRTDAREMWKRAALEAGMSPDDYLVAVLKGEIQITPSTEVEEQPDSATEETDTNEPKTSVDSAKIKVWEEDVKQLIEEFDSSEQSKPQTSKSKSRARKTSQRTKEDL